MFGLLYIPCRWRVNGGFVWGVLMFSSLIVLAACSGGPDRSLYPLDEKSTWEYDVSIQWNKDGAKSRMSANMTVTYLSQRKLGDQSVIPKKMTARLQRGGSQTSFEFIARDDVGIYLYATQSPNAMEPEILSDPNYLLKFPLENGASWEGTRKTSGLESAGFGKEVTVPVRTTVNTTNGTVTVPAKTFEECVKTTTRGKVIEEKEENPLLDKVAFSYKGTSWFCPDVGLVKSSEEQSKGRMGVAESLRSVKSTIQLKTFEK